MHRNAHTVEIERPAAAIFPYLVSADERLRWMGVLVASEQLTEGPPALGSRFRDVFEDQGHRIRVEAEIVAWEPNRRLATRLRGSAFEATATTRLDERDGLTRLATEIETDYQSLAVRLMAGVVTRHAQNRLEADLAALKELVEREAGA